MAVRTNASGEYLRRTASLPAIGAFTMCGWSKNTNRVANWQYFGIESAAEWILIGWSNADEFQLSTQVGGNVNFTAPSGEQWFFWAMVNESGVNCRARILRLGTDTTFQTASTTVSTFTPTQITLGNDSFDEWLNIATACVKVWDAALTDAELYQEIWTVRPQRTANLHLWSPLMVNSLDYSGNGRNWTEGGTLSLEDGPPVGWGAAPFFPVPAGSAPPPRFILGTH